ncbi:hypothetical protein Tco_0490615 [Tanacetum coccineum]
MLTSLQVIIALHFECSPSSSISAIKSLSSFLDEWEFRGLPTGILVHMMWGYWDGDVFVFGCKGQRVKVCSFDRNDPSTCMVVSHGWSCGVNETLGGGDVEGLPVTIGKIDVDEIKSTNNCFGGMMLIFGLLEALEMEALVDAMDVDNG